MTQADEFDQLVTSLETWDIPADTLEPVRSRSRETLDEVKGLVDYQDKAASGMLTVVAFLTAAASLVYERFASDYHWPDAFDSIGHVLTGITFLVFLTYLLLVAIAALLVFNALLPQYTEPQSWKAGLHGGPAKGVPFSTLYYLGILSVTPSQWGTFFTSLKGPRTHGVVQRGAEVDELYAKFGIIESYLVATDVQKKVDALRKAGRALKSAMIVLIAFALMYGATTILVKPDRSYAAMPPAAFAPSSVAPSSLKPSIRPHK